MKPCWYRVDAIVRVAGSDEVAVAGEVEGFLEREFDLIDLSVYEVTSTLGAAPECETGGMR